MKFDVFLLFWLCFKGSSLAFFFFAKHFTFLSGTITTAKRTLSSPQGLSVAMPFSAVTLRH